MKNLLYTEGPKRLKMGKLLFARGVARPVADQLADQLLKKKTVLFYLADKVPGAALKKLKALEDRETNASTPPAAAAANQEA